MREKELTVIAPAGKICPLQGGRRAGIINDKTAVKVPNTAFYRRMLAEGSLLPARLPKVEPAAKKGDK